MNEKYGFITPRGRYDALEYVRGQSSGIQTVLTVILTRPQPIDFSMDRQRTDIILKVARDEKGAIYRHLVTAAVLSKDPVQLANSLGAIGAISLSTPSSEEKEFDSYRTQFLTSRNYGSHLVSADAQKLKEEWVAQWKQLKGDTDTNFALEIISSMYFKSYGQKYSESVKGLIEAYISTLLDSKMPLSLRTAFLRRAFLLEFGRTDYRLRQFDENSTFWTYVTSDWVGYNYHAQPPPPEDPRDQIIARLQLERDAARLKAAEIPDLEKTIRSQEQTIEMLRKLSEDNEAMPKRKEYDQDELLERIEAELEKLRRVQELYKMLGGVSPFEILDIRAADWQVADINKRKELLRLAKRAAIKKYHEGTVNSMDEQQAKANLRKLLERKWLEANQAVDILEHKIEEKNPNF